MRIMRSDAGAVWWATTQRERCENPKAPNHPAIQEAWMAETALQFCRRQLIHEWTAATTLEACLRHSRGKPAPQGHPLQVTIQDSGSTAVASWLNKSSPPPNPPIHSCDKTGCGFYNDATAKLLCPVDFNWANTVAKEGIWNYEPNFQVTAHSWPSFLYRDGGYDWEDPTKGLFKGSFLIRLQFALSSCGSWRNLDDDFDHDQFYVYIVDYFEHPPPTAKASVDALLVWWNHCAKCVVMLCQPVILSDCIRKFEIIDHPTCPSIYRHPGWGIYGSSGSLVPSGNFKSTPNDE
ncbi:hypothetical protein EDB19DRAFT_1831902 [Suillus lakei]|nr:hypothetical protein EDB19DRAFT_1831902 [Suillus lakei]